MSNLTDEQIADRLVKAGIFHKDPAGQYWVQDHCLPPDGTRFISDWRVAGACLERMTGADLLGLSCPDYPKRPISAFDFIWLQKPRAICQAFAMSINDD